MQAIDLYSGIGGWTIGLQCAGIDVVASYELSTSAARTARRNLDALVHEVDLLAYDYKKMPSGIDLVVGSPPCTDFSFSNRGGSGDVAKGLEHVFKFLEIVAHVRPRFWAMENVPRLITFLFEQRSHYRRLKRFSQVLETADFRILDASTFGLPQRRLRAVIGNIPFELLTGYSHACTQKTLGDVIKSLRSDPVRDINFGLDLPLEHLTDHEVESCLDWEERRINQEAKQHHPVYNRMSFPDPLDRAVRTITATCTRVSRESIVIRDPQTKRGVRRLTIRERAALQGFPVAYQILGGSNAEKMRLVGNAMPPPLAYYIGNAALNRLPEKAIPLQSNGQLPFKALRLNCITALDKPGAKYPIDRRFRFVVPGMHFKSGMRFDLANILKQGHVSWAIQFYFGPSKDVRQIQVDGSLMRKMKRAASLKDILSRLDRIYLLTEKITKEWSAAEIQASWISKRRGEQHPFSVIDKIGQLMGQSVAKIRSADHPHIEKFVLGVANPRSKRKKPASEAKLRTHAVSIFCGLSIGYHFNKSMRRRAIKDVQKICSDLRSS